MFFFSVEVASALSQLLAVLLLAVGFASARRGSIRPEAFSAPAGVEGRRNVERLRKDARRRHLRARLLVLACGFAVVAVMLFIVTIALSTLPPFPEPRREVMVDVDYMFTLAIILTLGAAGVMVQGLMEDMLTHAGDPAGPEHPEGVSS